MITLFEVLLAPGADGEELLSKETQQDTSAELMTPARAQEAGFRGLGQGSPTRLRQLISCPHSQARRIQNVLEASAQVDSIKVHHLDA